MAKIKKLFQNESAALQFTFLGTLRQFAKVSLSTNFLYLFFILIDLGKTFFSTLETEPTKRILR
jgi:hypothetical protein